MALHDAAIKDEYFVKRKLAPNVDFWYVLLPTFLFQGCSYFVQEVSSASCFAWRNDIEHEYGGVQWFDLSSNG